MTRKVEAVSPQLLREGKSRDRALILPLVGLVLFTPPLASIFQLDTRVAGIPFTALYLFVVWALLIIGAGALARGLRADVSNEPVTAATSEPDSGSQPHNQSRPGA